MIWKRDRGRLEEGTRRSRQGFASRLMGVFKRSSLDEDDWEELEDLLISGDTGPQFAASFVKDLRASAGSAPSPSQLTELARRRLADSLTAARLCPPGEPAVVLVVGVNGSGKTTTIAKLAARLQAEGHSVMLAAADTFRAGAIAQLKHWGDVLGMRVVAQQPGSDPGSVAFDAASAAQASGVDYLIIDTAGRLQTDSNLMRELEKVSRVVGKRIAGAPHEKLIVLDGISGLNGISQARLFAESIGLDGVIISKLDGSAKGGVAFIVAGELGLPIKFVGTGEGTGDLAEFDPDTFVGAMFGD